MTRYILTENTKIRSYDNHPRVLMQRGNTHLAALSKEEFLYLLLCDGKHSLEETPLLTEMEKKGWIRPWKEGDPFLSDWQKFKKCNNRLYPYLALEITERCNCNCLHCFNATGVEVPREEMSFEQILDILDQAVDCGIQSVLITGGEPMLHPHFMDIIKAVHERGMFVYELNTNGSFLSQKILDEMKTYTPNTLFKISFDGVGFHDTMRGVKHSEEKAIDAIRRCINSGFRVRVQMNMNRLNLDTILPTLLLMDQLGVPRTRVIRTTETPRWVKTTPNGSLSWTEHFEKTTQIAVEYMKQHPGMTVDFWKFCKIFPKAGSIDFSSIRNLPDGFDPDRTVCPYIHNTVSISGGLKVFPCFQMSGFINASGVVLGDLKKEPLQSIIKDSQFARLAATSIKDRIDRNARCAGCPVLACCHGGCPAMGMLYQQDFYGSDKVSCIFYRDHWFEKVTKALPMLQPAVPFDPGTDVSYLEGFDIPDTQLFDPDSINCRY